MRVWRIVPLFALTAVGCASVESGFDPHRAAQYADNFHQKNLCRFIEIKQDAVKTKFDESCRDFELAVLRLKAGITIARIQGDPTYLKTEVNSELFRNPGYAGRLIETLRQDGTLGKDENLADLLFSQKERFEMNCDEAHAGSARTFRCQISNLSSMDVIFTP